MCVSVFAGCSLVEIDNERYLNATVATIEYESGQTENITKRELLTAYNSYGYYYVQNGASTQEAVKETIETIIDRKLTVKAVKDYYKNSQEKELNENETTYLWDETYDAMFENIKTYFEEIVDVPETAEEAEEAENASVFKQYQATVGLEYKDIVDENGNVVEENKLVIVKKSISESVRKSYTARQVGSDYVNYELEKSGSYPFKESLYNKLMSLKEAGTESSRSWTSAINNYIEDIKENYEYQNFASDKDAFMFEIDRVYNILKENYYAEKYAEIYNGQTSSLVSNITVDEILKTYSKNVRTDYTKYEIEEGDFAADILKDVSSIDYVKKGTNYFYLSYIKFEIDTDRLAELEELKNSGGTVDYEAEVAKVYQNAYAQERNANGELTGQTKTASYLANKIKGELDKEYWTVERLNNGSAESVAEKQNATELGLSDEQYVNKLNDEIALEKAEAFRPYFYLYNADDTYKNADYNAVFGVDNSGNILASETFSADEDLLSELKEFYNGGDIKVGQISKLIEADDAVYLFFYAGEVENIFPVVDQNFDISRSEDAIKTLATTKLNIFSNKTIFDSLYSSATKDKYSVFETLNMNYLRSLTEKIEIIENEIKDLY